jgi:hypothetical protein
MMRTYKLIALFCRKQVRLGRQYTLSSAEFVVDISRVSVVSLECSSVGIRLLLVLLSLISVPDFVGSRNAFGQPIIELFIVHLVVGNRCLLYFDPLSLILIEVDSIVFSQIPDMILHYLDQTSTCGLTVHTDTDTDTHTIVNRKRRLGDSGNVPN